MDEFDKTSFEIELADLLEKYGVQIELDIKNAQEGCICIVSNVFLESYGEVITPESLRNGS